MCVWTPGPVPFHNSQLCCWFEWFFFLHWICHYPSITSLALRGGFTFTVNILMESILVCYCTQQLRYKPQIYSYCRPSISFFFSVFHVTNIMCVKLKAHIYHKFCSLHKMMFTPQCLFSLRIPIKNALFSAEIFSWKL